jgi:hypothetical protein
VEETFLANVRPFVESVHEARDALLEAAAAAKTFQEVIDSLHGKTIDINLETTGAAGAAGMAAMAREAGNVAASAQDASRQVLILQKATQDSGAGAAAAAAGFRVFGTGLRLTGTAIHWVIAAGAEFLAVAIPAAVALGSAMLVAAQGAQMVQQHMSALYTATEATANMFHVTIGSALGLRSALQAAQDQANPIVWSVLGGAISIVKSNFQDLAAQGLDVMRIFQTFTAHVVQDFQQGFGNQIHGLLSGMVADLVMFGQVLGNVGHALLNFAAAMPGLAEVLLGLVTGASHLLLWFSSLPPILITVAMAMEEVWRWGGPLAAILTRIPALLAGLVASGFGVIPVFARVGQIFQALALIIPRLGVALGTGLIALGRWIPMLGEAGVAIGAFSEGIVAAIAAIPAWGLALAGAAAVGLGFLIYKMATAKTAVQQLTDSMQAQVDKASGLQIYSDIAANITRLTASLHDVTTASNGAAIAQTTMASVAAGKAGPAMSAAGAAATQYSTGLRQQTRDLLNTTQAVGFLSRAYGVSFVGALVLGTQAGVQWDQGIGKMSAAAEINLIKVQNLIAGYRAMGQPVGAVGTDMTALAIQAGLQSSKIQQLTQAWQGYMTLLTGGTNSLATFEQGLSNIGTVAASAAGRLFEAQGKMNASTQQFAASLQSFTGKGAQNWQNFNQVVTTGAEGFINWMQTAGAVGAVSGPQMAGAIKGVVAQLIPFATHSQAARAELAGLAAQTGAVVPPTTRALEAFAKGGMSAQQLARFVGEATAKLSDMAGVAAHLGNVMQSDLVGMFDKAKIAASGLPGALNSLASAIQNTGTHSTTTAGALLGVIGRLTSLHQSLPTITAMVNSMGFSLTQAQVKAIIAAAGLDKTGNSAATAGGKMGGAAGQARGLAAAISAIQSKTVTVTTNFVTTGSWAAGNPFQPGGMFSAKSAHMQAGGYVTNPGFFQVGEAGPELAFLPAGTRVLSNPDSRRFLNNPGGGAVLGGGAASGDAGPAHATIHNHVFLDGQQIWNGVRTETLRWNTRNGNPQSGAMGRAVAPGG